MAVWLKVAVFVAFAIPITLIDLKELRVPDALSLSGIGLMLLLDVFVIKESLPLLLIEVAAGFGVFWIIRLVTRGRLGLGDAKYSAFIASLCGNVCLVHHTGSRIHHGTRMRPDTPRPGQGEAHDPHTVCTISHARCDRIDRSGEHRPLDVKR